MESCHGNAELVAFEHSTPAPGRTVVKTTHRLGDQTADFFTEYHITGSGEVQVRAKVAPLKSDLPVMPRVGMNLVLKGDYKQLQWFGRGPHENYQDRNTGVGGDNSWGAKPLDKYLIPAATYRYQFCLIPLRSASDRGFD
ncbi:MAG TPA: hypothetical protein VE175_00785 [Woeseiaceae bacterium]|nr:hypothetical protein [Woeseiaceae bacterium]